MRVGGKQKGRWVGVGVGVGRWGLFVCLFVYNEIVGGLGFAV